MTYHSLEFDLVNLSSLRAKAVTKLLDDPVSAHRVSKFFLATRELLQFKHVNESVTSDDQIDPFEKTLRETEHSAECEHPHI
jgi:hypothetical protein